MMIRPKYSGIKITLLTQTVIFLLGFALVMTCVSLRKKLITDLYFLSIGNIGCNLPHQNAILNQMRLAVEKYGAKFVVDIGNGVSPISRMSRLEEPISKNFKQDKSLQPDFGVPCYRTGRNNQYINSMTGLVYTEASEGLLYFRQRVPLSFEHSMELIFIDSHSIEADKEQISWLEETLSNSTADWLAVVGYHDLKHISQARNACLADLLVPIFVKYEVHVYLHGEGHAVQYLEDQNILYIGNGVGGCGNKFIRPDEKRTAKVGHKVIWSRSDYEGFLLHHITALEMEFAFIALDGTILHRAIIRKDV